jgi:hypothetical protein
MKDYCIGYYHCYNGECIRGKGDYCPANYIKTQRRKEKGNYNEKRRLDKGGGYSAKAR